METLFDIGNYIAAVWGGICYDYEINEEKEEVVFLCEEHGEEFATTISFQELEESYHMDVEQAIEEERA